MIRHVSEKNDLFRTETYFNQQFKYVERFDETGNFINGNLYQIFPEAEVRYASVYFDGSLTLGQHVNFVSGRKAMSELIGTLQGIEEFFIELKTVRVK